VLRAVLVTLAIAGCAPAVRVAGRCPTVIAFGGDFSLTTAGLAGSVMAFNEGQTALAIGLATAAMSLALTDNLVECRR
jgi:hypothetical protein